MRATDYPAQEPFSEVAQRYHDMVMALGEGVTGAEFAYGDDPYQSLAVYSPEAPNGTVLAFAHGGGWTNGYKEWMAFMAPAFTAAGVVFVSIGYRLAPGHLFPSGFDDTIAAIAWMHGNIADHGGDPTCLFIGGHSAGGQYTALAAVRRDWPETLGLSANTIRGCLPISGVFLFGEDAGMKMRPQFLGDQANDFAASPLSHIHAPPPPFLIACGDNDFPHLIRQAGEMTTALEEAGGDVELVELAGRDHFTSSTAGGEPDGPWVPRALDWMARH
jgi:acetyl esterase/lipase